MSSFEALSLCILVIPIVLTYSSSVVYAPDIHALQLPPPKSPVSTSSDVPSIRKSRSASKDAFVKWKHSLADMKKIYARYYQCKINETLVKTSSISAVLALEGQRVDMKCSICGRPDQKNPQAFWQRVRIADASVTHVQKRLPGIRISKRMTLVIKAVDISDAGQYFCIQRGDSKAIYQLDVLFREPLKTVWENNTNALAKPSKHPDHNLEVFSHWSDWTECDQCGKNGRRMKYGTCMIKRTDPNLPLKPPEYDVPIMAMYPVGVPCRSTVLTRKLSNFEPVRKRPSQIIMAPCFQKCPSTPKTVIVTDKDGNKREIIEAGYYPLNKKPELPPMVKRESRYEAVGKEVVINCPTKNSGKIRWQRGERPINPATIRRQTKGRVFIDKLSRLHIKKVRLHDSAPYSCWEWQKHVATIKITVFEGFNANIKRYITYGGLFITIISIPLFCIYKLCFGKPKRGKK